MTREKAKKQMVEAIGNHYELDVIDDIFDDFEKLTRAKGLELFLVSTVKQEGFESTYLIVSESFEHLEKDKKIFNLQVFSSEYMLLTFDEANHIIKEGYLND